MSAETEKIWRGKALKLLIFLIMVSAVCHAQIMQQIVANSIAPSSGASPALVNFRGMASTEIGAVGTKTANTCATNAYCTQLVDPSLAGNGILVIYTYKSASGNTANIPTVSDDKTNTYTHCGTDANNSTDTTYVGCYYVLSATTGTRAITVTWTAAVSQAAVSVAQMMNVTAIDVYSGNSQNTVTGGSAIQAGSATSTAAGDLWFQAAIGTNTRTDVSTWTAGSQTGITWNVDLADQRDAAAVQHGVQTSAGALNAQITNATSNDYASIAVAFKSGSAGTAPTGMYIKHLYSVNSVIGITGNLAYQVPVSGNLIASLAVGAGEATGVSDTVNGAWKECGVPNIVPSQVTSSSFYAPNISPGLLNVTVTTTASGDIGPQIFADIVGAATTQTCGHAAPQGNISAVASTFTAMSNFAPSSSNGIAFYITGVAFNTMIGLSSPSSGGFDMNTYGGMSISGPEPVDENNGGAHFTFSANTPNSLTWNMTSATLAIDAEATDIAAFQAPGATLYPAEVGSASNGATTSGTTLAIASYAPSQAGDVMAFFACTSATTGTIAISGGTNTYTPVDGPTNLNGLRCATFYSLASSGSTTTFTATFGTTSTFRSLSVAEIANATALDAHHLVAVTSGAGGIYSPTATGTLTSANELIYSAFMCGASCDIRAAEISLGVNTSPWTFDAFDGLGNAAGFLAVGATTSITPWAFDFGGTGELGVNGMMSFK